MAAELRGDITIASEEVFEEGLVGVREALEGDEGDKNAIDERPQLHLTQIHSFLLQLLGKLVQEDDATREGLAMATIS